MRIAIFSDLHLGIKQDSTSWHEVALNWCDDFIDTLEKEKIDTAVFLGDFFHNRNTISVNTLHIAGKILSKFYLHKINLHMILGNHDLYYDNDPTVSGVNLFSLYDNVKVYQKPEIINFGSLSACMCGWGYDPLDYSADVLFTHAEINVFRYNNKQGECNGGLKCSDLLKKYNLVYAGHFHLRQEKKYTSGEVRYPGNPFQMDYSDEDCSKGIEILDTETREISFIENKLSPTFVRKRLSEMIRMDIEVLKDLIQNSYFKLIIDKNITLQDLNELMNLVNASLPRSSTFEWENGQNFSQTIDDGQFETFEITDAIKEFVQQMNIPSKDDIIVKLLELYKKASDL